MLVLTLLATASTFAQDSVANNMLLFQRVYGGWPKHFYNVKIDYNRSYTPEEKAFILKDVKKNDATIDNNATVKEIRHLLKAYKQHNNPDYLKAAEKGIKYLLTAQYQHGGWPQYYPDVSNYRAQVTYNDNAMVNVLNLLQDIVEKKKDTEVVSAELLSAAEQAVDKGINCILKTQITVDGKLTGWCAQYDERSLKPATARAFELPSISGMESVGVVQFLMRLPEPSPAVTTAINGAVEWFKAAAITGYKYVDIDEPSQPKGKDRLVVPEAGSTIWARFYDIKTNKPFFTGRDGVKHDNLKEIEVERRTGYAYYGTWPEKILQKQYPEWKQRVEKK